MNSLLELGKGGLSTEMDSADEFRQISSLNVTLDERNMAGILQRGHEEGAVFAKGELARVDTSRSENLLKGEGAVCLNGVVDDRV